MLHAWNLSSDSFKSENFRKKLPLRLKLTSGDPQLVYNRACGPSSPVVSWESIIPCKITVQQFADFCVPKKEERFLVAPINGCQAELNRALSLAGTNMNNNKIRCVLFQSFERSHQLRMSVVLESLSHPSYGHLRLFFRQTYDFKDVLPLGLGLIRESGGGALPVL